MRCRLPMRCTCISGRQSTPFLCNAGKGHLECFPGFPLKYCFDRQVADVTYTNSPCSGSSMHRKPSPWQSKKALKVAIAAAGCLSSRVEIAGREDDRDIRSWIDQKKGMSVQRQKGVYSGLRLF